MGEFGISQAVTRREDQSLLTGLGRFTDDQRPANCAFAYVFRTPVAHARITRLDCEQAKSAPGVLALYTADDVNTAGIQALPCVNAPVPRPGSAFIAHLQPVLAADTVRFIGDGLAFIVAETLAQARDAAELIELEYQTLPAVTEADAAAQNGAPSVWPDTPHNTGFELELGDPAAVQTAFDTAAHVVQLTERNNRVIISALEPRAALAEYDPPQNKLTLTVGTQMPNPTHTTLCQMLQIAPERLRVLVHDVGGGFGGKNSVYPEYALALHAARCLKRPVSWQSERSEACLSDYHGRDNITAGQLALDAEGRFMALNIHTYANLGAYLTGRGAVSPSNVHMACNTYAIPAVHIQVKGVYTHTTPTDVYRGAGRPEVLYLIERLVDVAAQDLGIDRVELRRRNFIPPDAFPYLTPTGLRYERCEFERIMDDALAQIDWSGFEQRRQQSIKTGKLRGIGLANYVERCGGGGGLSESAHLRFEPDGGVSLMIGSMSNGQGHATAYSQIIHERLGLPFEKIRVMQGDTDQIKTGRGTGGSWSIPMGGGALMLAADDLIEKARQHAAHMLEAATADIEFENAEFRIVGTDRKIRLAAVAHDFCQQKADAPLAGEARYQPDNYTFPYGCHICEVEVDPATGQVNILDYLAVHDFGHALNPLLLAGQVHGGVVQGIGQALLEHTVFDPDGQLLSGSLMDYCLPRAMDLPSLRFAHQDTPAPGNPLGVKGCGEAGAAGSPPALINALVHALSPCNIRHLDMPATAESIWRTIRMAD